MPSLSRRPMQFRVGRRAVVVGAGSFGTAIAILLARCGLRTTLQAHTSAQAGSLQRERENRAYLPGIPLPRELAIADVSAGLARAEFVFLGVPSHGLGTVIESLGTRELSPHVVVVSLAKGLVPPHGTPPTALLRRHFGANRVACLGGPAHARELVSEGAALVAASSDHELAGVLAEMFIRAGVVCEQSDDPVGVELAGVAKNAAALASGATELQGLNAAGAAAGHIFAEVWRWAQAQGARAESMIGLAGTGDLVATALAPDSRNRRAGELLAQGVRTHEIPGHLGQAVEALETVPLLATAMSSAGFDAPVTTALAQLTRGELPLEDWIAIVRTTVPAPPRRPSVLHRGLWRQLTDWLRRLFKHRPDDDKPR